MSRQWWFRDADLDAAPVKGSVEVSSVRSSRSSPERPGQRRGITRRSLAVLAVVGTVALVASGCGGNSELVGEWEGLVIEGGGEDAERGDFGLDLQEAEDGGVTGEMTLVLEGEDPGDPVPVSGETGEDDSFVLEGEQYGTTVTIDGKMDSDDEMSGEMRLGSAFGGGSIVFAAERSD